jgi:Cu+-exporting ATPase
MTCASCANRIERKLNKLDGVTASVNYATEKAAVTFDDGAVSTDDLIGAGPRRGYDAVLPAPAGEGERGRPRRTTPSRCATGSSSPPSCPCRCCCCR